MKLRWLIVALVLAVLIFGVWVFSQKPEKVEMARYVPAETLVYLEAGDLPEVLNAFASTAAWQQLAPVYGIRRDFADFGWLSQFLATANLGSTETVIFGRSQIAVALFGFEAAGAEETLKIKPRYAVIIETKTNAATAGRFVEKQIGDFARRQFAETGIEKLERDNANWTIFRSTKDERKLFAAVVAGTIVFGNDETAIKSSLEAKSELRPSLAQSPRLNEMREQLNADGALAFGFVTAEGVKKLSELGAVLFAGQIAEEPAAMSLIAQSLPPMIEKTVTGIGWTARAAEGKIEDVYFVRLPPDLPARLREPLAVSNQPKYQAAQFLPSDADSVTVYNLKNPGAAWRAFILAISSKLDVLAAGAFAQTAGNLLAPYGVSQPNDFLSAAGEELITARLSAGENDTVAIVQVADADKMMRGVESAGKERNRAAKISNGLMFLGENEDIAKCFASQNEINLAKTELWREFTQTKLSSNTAFIRTFTRNSDSPSDFVKIFADKNAKQRAAPNFDFQSVSFSETVLLNDGFERRTRSAFGLIGWLAAGFNE